MAEVSTKPGSIIGGKYFIDSRIGQGQNSIVYKVYSVMTPGQPLAAKEVSREKLQKSRSYKELFENEVRVMSQVKHENILHLKDLVQTQTEIYLITELCEDGTLESYMHMRKRLPEREAIFFLKQIMSAFIELHIHKVIHRDLKMANIYLTQGCSKLIIGDFGFSRLGEVTTTSKVGTPYYMAPEILFSRSGLPYTSKCDLYSIGVIYFSMLYGRLPFPAISVSDLETMTDRFSGQNLQIPISPITSDQSKDLLRSLLEKDPIERIAWKGFFNHELFSIEGLNDFIPLVLTSSINTNLSSKVPLIQSSSVKLSHKELQVNTKFENEKRAVSDKNSSHLSDLIFFEPINEGELERSYSVNTLNSNRISINTDLGLASSFFMVYTHERNKVRFMMMTARRGSSILKYMHTKEILEPILISSYLLSVKAFKLTQYLCNSISKRLNCFNLEDFEENVTSSQGNTMLMNLRKDEESASSYKERMFQLFCQEKERLVHTKPQFVERAMSKDIPLDDIDFIVSINSRLIAASCLSMSTHTKSLVDLEVKLFVGECEYCREIDPKFPLKDKSGKFYDWLSFNSKPNQARFTEYCSSLLEMLAKEGGGKQASCSLLCSSVFCR